MTRWSRFGLLVWIAACQWPYPAGIDAGDSDATADDGGVSVDGDVDARLPIVTNNQAADMVLGAADFTSNGRTGFSAISVHPGALASDGTTLWVADVQRQRVMGWSPLPTATDAPATRVLGRPSLNDSTEIATGLATTQGPAGLEATGGRVVLVDGTWSRFLTWAPAPTTNGEAADAFHGQSTATETSSATAPGRYRGPRGVWTDGTMLIIADQWNHRVLIWTTFPSSATTPANVVLGQTSQSTALTYSPPVSTSMTYPSDVHFDGTRLYIADMLNNRVMIWYGVPGFDNAPAAVILGQPDASSSQARSTAAGMNEPKALATAGNALFVADSGNDRVLVYSPIPSSTGAAATYVLGQPDPNSVVGNNPPPSASNLADPWGLLVAGDKLFVSDYGHSRLLRFHLNL